MNDEQNNYQSSFPILPPETQVDICKVCGQNPCACSNKKVSCSAHGDITTFNEAVSQDKDKQEDREKLSEKKPPKIRWM